jgi:hypothetical protein
VLSQEGRAGVPWFRVSDGLVSAADWRLLLGRAVQVMLGLRSATRATPAWTGTIDVGAELERQAALCEANGMTLSEPVRARVSDWARRIAGDGPVQTAWQHGDFSLNNLLVTNDSIAIIDFDEFGETLVPLHDAFGLALSVRLSQAGCPLSLPECIRLAVAPAMIDEAVTAAQLPALLMHHLLWRLNQCVGLERRASLARTMLAWTDEFARDPRQFMAVEEW